MTQIKDLNADNKTVHHTLNCVLLSVNPRSFSRKLMQLYVTDFTHNPQVGTQGLPGYDFELGRQPIYNTQVLMTTMRYYKFKDLCLQMYHMLDIGSLDRSNGGLPMNFKEYMESLQARLPFFGVLVRMRVTNFKLFRNILECDVTDFEMIEKKKLSSESGYSDNGLGLVKDFVLKVGQDYLVRNMRYVKKCVPDKVFKECGINIGALEAESSSYRIACNNLIASSDEFNSDSSGSDSDPDVDRRIEARNNKCQSDSINSINKVKEATVKNAQRNPTRKTNDNNNITGKSSINKKKIPAEISSVDSDDSVIETSNVSMIDCNTAGPSLAAQVSHNDELEVYENFIDSLAELNPNIKTEPEETKPLLINDAETLNEFTEIAPFCSMVELNRNINEIPEGEVYAIKGKIVDFNEDHGIIAYKTQSKYDLPKLKSISLTITDNFINDADGGGTGAGICSTDQALDVQNFVINGKNSLRIELDTVEEILRFFDIEEVEWLYVKQEELVQKVYSLIGRQLNAVNLHRQQEFMIYKKQRQVNSRFSHAVWAAKGLRMSMLE